MTFNSHNDCRTYLNSAEWLRVSDVINEWCHTDNSCKEIKRLAILGACERNEIEYTRNDGKDFDDPVMDLYGRGLLLINKKSFYAWKNKFDRALNQPITQKVTTKQNLVTALKSIDNEYISVGDTLDAIRKYIGLDRPEEEAIQIFYMAIQQALVKPSVYMKDKHKGWREVIIFRSRYSSGDEFINAPNPSEESKLETIEFVVDQEVKRREDALINKLREQYDDDDLPF